MYFIIVVQPSVKIHFIYSHACINHYECIGSIDSVLVVNSPALKLNASATELGGILSFKMN